MKVGDKFSSFDQLLSVIKEYEKTVFSNYWIRDSKTLSSQAKCFPKGRCSKAKSDLKYYFVRYSCIKGGRQFPPKNKQRKTFTFKQHCDSHINVVLSQCGQYLVVKDLQETHNHEHTEQQFKTLPYQRLNFDKEEINKLVSTKGNKKLIQNNVFQKTGCLVTLRDITNLNRKPAAEQRNFSECINLLRDIYNCFVDVQSDSEGNVKGVFFQDYEMKKAFDTYPEVLFMDGTYCLHDSRASTYLLVVEDGDGKACVAAVGILVNEDIETIDWFLGVFVRENPSVDKTKVIMTDKDNKERSSLKKYFPTASLQICLFHTLQIFNREISNKNLQLTSTECEQVKNILVKLAYSKSAEEYGEHYRTLQNTAPEAALNYFNKNWHSVRDEWVMYANLSKASFLNKTNNKLENLNKQLKTIITKYSQLEEFIKNFFVFIYSYRTNRNVSSSKQFHKVSTSPIEENSPAYKYRKLLTDFAFTKVEHELKTFPHCQLLELDNQQYLVPTDQGMIQVNVTSCECFFWSSMGLPCRHILKARETLNLCLYDEKLCLTRWTKKHYMDSNPFYTGEEKIVNNQEIVIEVQEEKITRRRALTSHEKFKKMNEECLILSKLSSNISSPMFYKRLNFIKSLQKKWANLEDDNGDMTTDTIEFHEGSDLREDDNIDITTDTIECHKGKNPEDMTINTIECHKGNDILEDDNGDMTTDTTEFHEENDLKDDNGDMTTDTIECHEGNDVIKDVSQCYHDYTTKVKPANPTLSIPKVKSRGRPRGMGNTAIGLKRKRKNLV